jgi:hypothetical protein
MHAGNINTVNRQIRVGVGARRPKRFVRGVSMIESLVAVPIVLFLGLVCLQWALVFQARFALTHALQEASRAGATGFAQETAIRSGLARGLVPFLYGASDYASYQASLARSILHVQAGTSAGFIRLNMLSPTNETFTDWARAARDTQGDVIPNLVEIPNDNLSGLASNQTPSTAGTNQRLGYSVGASSNQTLSDANILKLELTYGVPLIVPLVGRITAELLKVLDGCSGAGIAAGAGRAWACLYYSSVDERGNAVPRLPVLISSQVRMQTPARKSAMNIASVGAPATGTNFGLGQVDASASFRPSAIASFNPNGPPPAPLLSNGQAGFLQFGADRVLPIPSSCF